MGIEARIPKGFQKKEVLRGSDTLGGITDCVRFLGRGGETVKTIGPLSLWTTGNSSIGPMSDSIDYKYNIHSEKRNERRKWMARRRGTEPGLCWGFSDAISNPSSDTKWHPG